MADDLARIGRDLQRRWLERRRDLQSALAQAVEHRQPREGDDWIAALYWHARGDNTALVGYLRSDAAMTAEHREMLAQVLDGVLDRAARIGRPKDQATRDAALATSAFVAAWKAEAQAAGVAVHGRLSWMRDEAARFVAEDLEPETGADPEAVVMLLDRPKNRQK